MSRETVIIARGELAAADRKAVVQILGTLSMDVRVMDPRIYDRILGRPVPEWEIPYSLEEINDPEQYLSREHLLEFWQIYASDHTKKTATLAFNALVDWLFEIPSYGKTSEEIETFPVKNRADVGFPPIKSQPPLTDNTKEKAQFVVQVGAMLDFADSLRERGFKWRLEGYNPRPRRRLATNFGQGPQDFLLRLADHLDSVRNPKLFEPGDSR